MKIKKVLQAVLDKIKAKKFSLKWQLIIIISVIVIVALGVMISMVTYFFKDDTEKRIEQSNNRIVSMASSQVSQNLAVVINATHLLITGADSVGLSGLDQYIDYFFANNSSILYVGIESLNIHYYNSNLIFEEHLTTSYFDNIVIEFSKESELALERDKPVFFNTSEDVGFPSMGIAMPYRQGRGDQSLIILVDLRPNLLELVQSSDITTIFMLNKRGDLLLHSDDLLVMENENWSERPFFTQIFDNLFNPFKIDYHNENKDRFMLISNQLSVGGLVVVAQTPYAEAFQPVYRLLFRNILILGIVILFVILVVYFIAKGIVSPVLKLVWATKEVEAGRFDITIDTKRKNNEIGTLIDAFGSMAGGLAERERIKEAFGRFVNKDVADMASKGELKVGGEMRKCTIFFSDIRSFTAISESLEPHEVVEFLNDYMSRMVECVTKTHGVVDKFIGDAVMALWGVPVSQGEKNDIINAINGALMMRQALIDFNVGRGGSKKPIIKIGSGLNYGDVIAGQIGSNQRMEYTVIGDAVNLASRIESLNKPMGTDLLISSEIKERLGDDASLFSLVPMQKIMVKGKSKAQQIYAVLGRTDDPETPKDLKALRKLLDITGDFSKVQSNDKSLEEKEVKYEILD